MKLGEAPKSDAPAQPEALLASSSLKSRPASLAPAWSPPIHFLLRAGLLLHAFFVPITQKTWICHHSGLPSLPFLLPCPLPSGHTPLPHPDWPAGMGCTYTETVPWLFPLLRMPFTKIPAWLASLPP